MKITSDAYLYSLNITRWKEQLKSCLKLNQTGRLRTDLDADAVLHCNCEMPSRTRKSDKVIAQPCNAAACVWWGRGKCAWKLWGNSERCGGSSFLSPTKREMFSLYPLENAEIQICSTPQWHKDKTGFPFPSMQAAHFLCHLLTFYAI